MVHERDNPDRGLYVSLDVPEHKLRQLCANTSNIEGVRGFVIGAPTALEMGLSLAVDTVQIVNSVTSRSPILIYDHQSAGNDIPRNATRLMQVVNRSGIHKVIIYPSTNPEIAEPWIKAGQDHHLDVIVGKETTQDIAPLNGIYDDVFRLAAKLGVREFMLPGNKPDRVAHYRSIIESVVSQDPYTIYASGFGSQGGTVESFAKAAGEHTHWNLLIGSDIHTAPNPRIRAEEYIEEIRKNSLQHG